MKTRTAVWILVSLALLSLPRAGRGQEADAAPAFSFHFRHLTIDDGLSQSSVMAVLQDNRGFMWLGTQNGLNRFDGYTVRVYRYDSTRPETISNSYIRCVFEDGQGRLWVGTDGGLNRYDRDRDEFVRYLHDPADDSTLPGDGVRAIAEDSHGVLWVGTIDGGLGRLDPITDGFTRYRSDPSDPTSLSSDAVRRILPVPAGHFLVATDRGLDVFDPESGRFGHHRHDPDVLSTLSSDDVTALVLDAPGVVWVGTSAGLNLLDIGNGRAERFLSDPDDHATIGGDDVSALYIDRHGLLWVGSATSGLTVVDRRTRRVERIRADLLNSQGLHDDLITDLAEDDSGVLWVGTQSVGVERVQPATTGLYRHHPLRASTLSSNVIWAFAERFDGLIWVGTRLGLNLLAPASGRVVRFGHVDGAARALSTKTVRALEIDSAGRLWVGTSGAGLFRVDQSSAQIAQYRHDPGRADSLPDDRVYALFEDGARRLWVGTELGLARLDPGRAGFVVFRHDPSVPTSLGADEVRHIYQDREGTIWIGTRDGGLNRYEPTTGRFTRFTHDPDDPGSLSSDKVWSMYDDGRSLWVGTLGGGLNRMDRTTGAFERFTTADGLSDDVVYGILEDDAGYLWLSTNDGITRFSPATREFRRLGTGHGLQGKEFNSGAFRRARDGRLWFGGLSGANVVDPTHALDRSYEPRVVMTSLTLDGAPVGPGPGPGGRTVLETAINEASTVRLAHDDGRVTFEFAALDYAQLHAAEYAYRLDGVDEEWTYTGAARVASYSQLRPGEYRLHVRATNSDKVWSGHEASVDVIVEPAFWQTWWFSGLGLASVILAFGLWYVQKVRTVRRRAEALERQVRLRTEQIQGQVDVIGQQKAELEDALSELAAAKDQLVAHAHRAGMAEIATGVLHNIGNLQNSIATSCTVIRQRLLHSKSSGLARANDLLRTHEDRLAAFLTEDERGRKLPGYYYKLQAVLEQERADLASETDRLAEKVAAVGDVIASQQEVARGAAFAEDVALPELIDHALLLEASSLGNHDVKIVKRFAEVPRITAQKSKLLQVLVNLLKNAKDAMKDVDHARRIITIGIDRDGDAVCVTVADAGHGIDAAGLAKIFSYGFTTKPKGHGFGLHSCANYATEMGGELSVASAGVGCGATFTLTLPLDAAAAQAA